MTIFPATDLVTDVASAADPERVKAAVARLADLSSRKVDPREFAALVAGAKGGAPTEAARTRTADATVAATNSAAAIAQPSDPAQKFEAYIIQTCLQTILPQSGQGYFGRSAGSDVWRSMVAEQLGEQIAKAGGFGLHKMLDAHLARLSAHANGPQAGDDAT